MTLTLFAAIGLLFALLAVMVVARAQATSPSPTLASGTTLVGLADPATEALSECAPVGCVPADATATTAQVGADWQLATTATLSEAEDLLDLLEAQGFAERELVILGNSCFAVRWR